MRNWKKPMAVVDTFAANEFVSSCGDNGTIYNFTCDAPKGTLYYYPNTDGQIDGKHNPMEKASSMGSYYPCNAKHQAPKTDVFYDGFVDYNHNRRQDDGEGVIVWRERKHGYLGSTYYNGHATTKLDMNHWETAKS